MNKFFKKLKIPKRARARRRMVAASSVAVVLALAVFIGSGVPQTAYAWIISIWSTYTPLTIGGYTTISWNAPTSDSCSLSGPFTPCVSFNGINAFCGYMVSGQSGSYTVGPINGPASYSISCYNVSGGWGSSDGRGYTSFTVVPSPVPTTLSSFSATPATVDSGQASTLSWSGTKGTGFNTCRLRGGRFGESTWFTALPGSISTEGLSNTTTYTFVCFDTNGTMTPELSTTVTVRPASNTDVCSNIPGTQTSAPTNGTASGGTCSCNTGFTLQGATCVAVATDVCSNIAGTQTSAPANGTANSNGTCSCNAGFQLSGASCVAVPASCTGAHQVGTPPNCTCATGYTMQGGTCVQAVCPGANEVNWPTCSCATGFTRDTATNMCIRQAQLDIKVDGLDATRVRRGNTVAVTWSATGVIPASCRVTTNAGATIATTDSGSASPVVANQTTYRLSCTNDAGTVVTKEANVTLIPAVNEQ